MLKMQLKCSSPQMMASGRNASGEGRSDCIKNTNWTWFFFSFFSFFVGDGGVVVTRVKGLRGLESEREQGA